jgi:O-glycosyl hydrolase
MGAQSDGNTSNLVQLAGTNSSTTVTPSGTLRAFVMFSRYIRPNAVRIATSGASTNTSVAAFTNADGTVVVIMLNEGSETQSISLGGVSTSSASAYVMDNSVSSPAALPVIHIGGLIEATLPPFSVVTFVLHREGRL